MTDLCPQYINAGSRNRKMSAKRSLNNYPFSWRLSENVDLEVLRNGDWMKSVLRSRRRSVDVAKKHRRAVSGAESDMAEVTVRLKSLLSMYRN